MKDDILNKFATHPLQAYEWGEFREKTGIKIIRTNEYQLSIHKVPKTPWTIGYLPKGQIPNKKIVEELREIAKKEKCIFIQLEPNIETSEENIKKIFQLGLKPSFHPLFTKFTFQLDLTKNEECLLKNMHPKTRYNIKIAKKHNVKIIEDNSMTAFKQYLRLAKETTKRQKFYAHTEKYHQLMWNTLSVKKVSYFSKNKLTAHLFLAKYKDKILTAWVLFVFKDTLYYPYGASSSENREVMASNLMMWETIKFGKSLGLKKFDMWGSLGPNPNKNDPWYGFHRFKQGYGAKLIEFVGSYDLIINKKLYWLYKTADKIRWVMLKIMR